MKTIALAVTFLAALPLALSAQVNKEEVKKLAAAGISDEVILSYVKANGGVGHLSAEDVVELKQSGASEKLLAALLGSTPAPARSAAQAPAQMPPQAQAPVAPVDPSTYAVPATTAAVYDSTPYYSPTYSYYAGYPYYYPYYYPSLYLGIGGWWGGRYCSPGFRWGSSGHVFTTRGGFGGGGVIRHR